jgi:predicted alpha/beta hydrolase family esterase
VASYAAASYCSPGTITNWTCDRCTSERVEGFVPAAVVYDEAWNLQAYIGFSPELASILVVFRGTKSSSLTNWIHNLMASKTRVKYPGMPDGATVHDGFYRSWTRSVLQKQINAAIQAVQAERGAGVPVVVIGHSLGGALATLCAAELVTEYNLTAVRLFTFGCPRVGNAKFAKALKNTSLVNTRVVHDRDIVPSVPFQDLGFHHAAREVWQRRIRVGRTPFAIVVEITCDESGEDKRCQDSLCGTPGGCTSVADHLTYLDVPLGGRKGFDC